jgi:alpha-tubulin suppressor-like RCC1 family protein
VVLTTGGVRCWGSNEFGQLGYGHLQTIGDDEVPASVGEVDVGAAVVEIRTGAAHTCARLENGDVRCWGRNNRGELGYGHNENIGDDETPAVAGVVDIGGPATALMLGGAHSCALREDGQVVCWGSGNRGQTGLAHTNHISDDPGETPASQGVLNLGGPALHLASGGAHACALLESGSVRCWGYNAEGELGYGRVDDIGDDEHPSSVGPVQIGGTVEQLSSGYIHTCAIIDDGALRCWGFGSDGALGYGNTDHVGDDETPAEAGDVAVGGRVVDVATGITHTCALLDTGVVRCWGSAASGQLGYGSAVPTTAHIGDDEAPSAAGPVQVL